MRRTLISVVGLFAGTALLVGVKSTAFGTPAGYVAGATLNPAAAGGGQSPRPATTPGGTPAPSTTPQPGLTTSAAGGPGAPTATKTAPSHPALRPRPPRLHLPPSLLPAHTSPCRRPSPRPASPRRAATATTTRSR